MIRSAMNKVCIGCLVFCCLFSCSDYTPKPKGYLRIEPEAPRYMPFSKDGMPFAFDISHLAVVELPPAGLPPTWVNIGYPTLKAKIYCSYLPVTRQAFPEIDRESRALLLRQVRQATVAEKAYSHPEANVYATLFEVSGEAPSPIQFIVTDSVKHFFRGALYYEQYGNADSIAPVTRYLQTDIRELIQSFYWKN